MNLTVELKLKVNNKKMIQFLNPVIFMLLFLSSCSDEELVCVNSSKNLDFGVFKMNQNSEYVIKFRKAQSKNTWDKLFSTSIHDSDYSYCDGLQIDEVTEKSSIVVGFDNKSAISYNEGTTWKVRSGR